LGDAYRDDAMDSEPHTHAVLLVDDDADTREAIAFYLRSQGYDVMTATGGAEALLRLEAGLDPCVLIVEALMPGMSGWDLLKRMRGAPSLAGIPAVMLSGYPEQAGLALRLGVRAYITKPPDVDTIAAVVAQHCRRTALTA
jgi:CheY-like chemotaxis protein